MNGLFGRITFVCCLAFCLSSCFSSSMQAEPETPSVEVLKKIQAENQKLSRQNQEFSSQIKNLQELRGSDKQAFEKRLAAMEQTIVLMEQNLETSGPVRPAQTPAQKPIPLVQTTEPSTFSPAIESAVKKVTLPKMEPLAPGQRSKIKDPNSRVFVVPKPAPVLRNSKAPAVSAMKSESMRPVEISTPQGSSAIASAQLKQPKPLARGTAPEKQLRAQKNEIWEDPDLEDPVSPIKLEVFAAAKRKYNEAFKAYTRKDYQGAADQFDFFLSRFPNDIDADNAQFWRGMALFDIDQWDRAEEEFRKVLRNYKHGDTRMGFKTPDAVLMIAKIYLKKKKPIRARYYFSWVVEKFGQSRSANKAQRELDSMKTAGRQ